MFGRVPHPRLFFIFFAFAFVFGSIFYALRQQPVLACQSRHEQIENTVTAESSCKTDADCGLLINGCGAYTTCGKAVRADAVSGLTLQVESFNRACSGFGPTICVSCIPLRARCVEMLCIAEEVR